MKQSSKLLINESPLQVLPTLAKAIGLNESIFLQQLQYWLAGSQHEIDGRKWIYNTAEEWAKQFPFWSEPTVRRIIVNLRERGLILTRNDLNRQKMDRTLWFAIDYEALDNIVFIEANDQDDQTIRSPAANGLDHPDHDYTNRLPETSSREPDAAAAKSPVEPRHVSDFVLAYERIWGLTISSPYIGEQVTEWESRVTIDGWRYALEECADKRHIGDWKYFKSILERLERDGYLPKASPSPAKSVLDFSFDELV